MIINRSTHIKRTLVMTMLAVFVCLGMIRVNADAAGKTFTDEDGIKYKIIKEATEEDSGTCQIIGANSKKITELAIAAYVEREVDEDDAFEYEVISIKKGAFKNFLRLKEVELDSDSLIKAIPDNAFSGCKKLEAVNLSNSGLKSIGKNAFSGCSKLKEIRVYSKNIKQKSVKANAFKGTPKGLKVEGCSTAYSKKYAKFFAKRGAISPKAVKVDAEEEDDEDDDSED